MPIFMVNGFEVKSLLLMASYTLFPSTLKPFPNYHIKQCPPTRDGALNVHIIPHSHMDAGWVKTFDQYYHGTKSSISTANVQLIYHSVLSELLHDKRRKFTFSETGYFWRWWKEQRGTTRSTFRSLVAEGRIQFAGGGWVQADEATVDYLQLLDQYTWGLRKLNDTLGPCGTPKAAWQVDTYGHTKEHSSLLAQMGFDGLFIGRVDHKEREAMLEEDRMEFMWKGSDVLGKMSDILTHTLYNLYNAPDGFCFDLLCSDEPIVDDPDSSVYNADIRVNTFISQVEKQAKYYDHDNIMVTMGGDFTYQSAANWFMNIDKLINHVTAHRANISDINIFYSTPSCYLKAIYLYGRRDKALYTEKGDHLPYGSDVNTYWTGFYTSRPSLKFLAMRAHVFLQIVKQLSVLSRMGDSYELHLLRHSVGLMLHHDAITGTSQQQVANDFIKILSEAIDACTKKVSQFLSVLTPTWGGSRRPKNSQQFIVCHQLNMSQCRFTETQESILLIVYNPLSIKTYHHIRLPTIALHYSIRDFKDEDVEYQLVPLPAAVINLPGRSSTAIQEIFFEAENIPPMGFTTYYMSSIRDQLAEGEFSKKSQNPEIEQEFLPFISNEYIKVTVNKTTGLLESIQHVDGIKMSISQNWYYYSQVQNIQNSGVYSFRPAQEKPISVTDTVMYHTIRGSLVKEIRQRFTDWITQIIRLYRGEEFVEIEWIIGPVPIGNDLGKEVVTIFKSNITNNGIFYTDSNGRQMIKRSCLNESSGGTSKRKLAACQYPVRKICLENSRDGLCVLTDRAQAGTSYNDGEIELMVHRRLLTDDGFGLEEALNEEEFGLGLVVRGKHRIFVGSHKQDVDDLSFFERASQMYRRWVYEPWLFLTQGEKISRRKWQNVRNKRFTGLRLHGLPHHIHILTLEPWKGGSVLLRLENTLEKSHGPPNLGGNLPNPSLITVDLKKIFLFIITRVEETTLGANQWLQQARQMDWSSRYVYNGGDDGILPEDNPDYIDELKMSKQEDKENDPYSDEENYSRGNSKQGQLRKKLRTKNKFSIKNRRKRSTNISENSIDDTKYGNETDGDNVYKNTILRNESVTVKPEIIKNITKTSRKFTTLKTTRMPAIHFEIPKKGFVGYSREDDEGLFQEDFPPKLKKRRNKRRNRTSLNCEETDGFDDGVTKSMYEMYYKVKSREKSFKSYLRSSEEYKEQSRINNRKRNNGITSRRKNKTYRDQTNSDEGISSRTFRKVNSEEHTRRTNRKFRVDNKNTQKLRKSRRLKKDYSGENTSRSKRRKDPAVGMPFITENHDGENKKGRKREKYREQEYRGRVYPREESKSRKRRIEDADASQEEEMSSPEEEVDNEEDQFIERKKRAIAEHPENSEHSEHPEHFEQSEQDQEDFLITLRPTQIRTFIIWFEKKKSYTL
ncbi:unnamed protein product, partial [Brenthis ino]